MLTQDNYTLNYLQTFVLLYSNMTYKKAVRQKYHKQRLSLSQKIIMS